MENILNNPNFKRWFGSSKVVDGTGKPLIAYHYTSSKEPFNTFKVDRHDIGIHFGTQKSSNDRYNTVRSLPFQLEQGSIFPVYLRIENPIVTKDLVTDWDIAERYITGIVKPTKLKKEVLEEMKVLINIQSLRKFFIDKGFDGIIYKNKYEDKGSWSYIVFSPNQIKSAISNNGNYDLNNPNINESETHTFPLELLL